MNPSRCPPTKIKGKRSSNSTYWFKFIYSLGENSDLTFQKREGVGSTLPEYWNSNLWLAFILARSTDTSGTLSTPVMNNSIAVMKYLCVGGR